jgi:hypothetical protein
MKLQPAVKTETRKIALATGVCVLIMFAVFFVLHMAIPESWKPYLIAIPFDYKVILGGIGGFLVAVGNFFGMAVTVQKVTSMDDDKAARAAMAVSYRNRFLAQILWGLLAIVVPIFNPVSGIVPLLFPTLYIKLRGIISAGKGG